MSTLFNHGIDSQLDFGHYFTLDFQESFLCYLCVLHFELSSTFSPKLVASS